MKQLLRIVIIFALLFSFAYLISPLIVPIFFGILLFPVTFPSYEKLVKRNWNKTLSALLVINLFLAVFMVPGILMGIHGANITLKYLKQSENMEDRTQNLVDGQQKNVERLEKFSQKMEDQFGLQVPPIEDLLKDNIQRLSSFLITALSNALRMVPDLILAYVILLLTMYFTLVESEVLRGFLLRNTLLSKERSQKLLYILYTCGRSVIFSNVLTGVVQAVIVALGAVLTRSGDFFVTAFITFIFSFIPVIGAAPVAFVLGIYRMTTGDVTPGVILCIVGFIAGISDNVLRPIFLKGSIDVHPFLILMAIIGGVILFGLPGLFIGPLVMTIVHETVPLYMDEYKENKPKTDV